MKKKYTTIDLCAGIGGIRKGFEKTNKFKNILSSEIDENASRLYEHVFGNDPRKDVTSSEFLADVKNLGHFDVLLAGFPCQTFSSVGKREGFNDSTRGTIFFSIEKIIKESRPKAFFLENVQNLVSHNNGATISTIIKSLDLKLNYKIVGVTKDENGNLCFSSKTLVRNSKMFGIPQNRPRTYLIGFDRKFFKNKIQLLHDELPQRNSKTIFPDVNSILDVDVDDKYYLSSGYLETLKKHKITQKNKGYGFGYCVVNANHHNVANTIMATGGSGKERNLVCQYKDGIPGKVIPGKKTPLNSEYIRLMTPEEWGRLQGFIGYAFIEDGKETFSFPENFSDAAKYKVFGNSVTIPVIETMAEYILECFKKMGY